MLLNARHPRLIDGAFFLINKEYIIFICFYFFRSLFHHLLLLLLSKYESQTKASLLTGILSNILNHCKYKQAQVRVLD
jgi:hypothetical protein